MSDFVYDRDQLTVITLRVPRRVWDHWEYRHRDFGKAIHALRENCIEIMGARTPAPYRDVPDPFYRDPNDSGPSYAPRASR
jgi:hypothetical protein